MTIAIVSQRRPSGLPPALSAAQAAIKLPEVQDMLRRLSAHHLGICMPHMHDEQTGDFQSLPEALTQVESGLRVSFEPTQVIEGQSDRFLPVGWYWRAGAPTVLAACEMIRDESPGEPVRYDKHKMIEAT